MQKCATIVRCTWSCGLFSNITKVRSLRRPRNTVPSTTVNYDPAVRTTTMSILSKWSPLQFIVFAGYTHSLSSNWFPGRNMTSERRKNKLRWSFILLLIVFLWIRNCCQIPATVHAFPVAPSSTNNFPYYRQWIPALSSHEHFKYRSCHCAQTKANSDKDVPRKTTTAVPTTKRRVESIRRYTLGKANQPLDREVVHHGPTTKNPVSSHPATVQSNFESNNSNHPSSDEVWNVSLKSFTMDLHNLALEDPQKAEDAVQIMLEMYTQEPDKETTFLPDATCYTIVMDGYIQAGQLQQAQRILDQMESLAKLDEAQHYTTITQHNRTQTSRPAYTSILAPTDWTYLLMAQAWADDYREDFAGTTAQKAVQVLRRMQTAAEFRQLSLTGATTTTTTANIRHPERTSCSDSTSEVTSSMVKVWSIVVEGWCKRAGIARHAMKAAEDLLDEMEGAPATKRNDDNIITTTTTTNVWVRPNVLTYTSYIGGLSRCGQHDMARKAEAVLERMERFGVQPDMVAYTAVLNCYAKAVSRRERGMAAARALSLVAEMEHLYIHKRVYSMKPSHITYAAAISAIGNSLDPAAPDLAEGVLKRMYKMSKEGTIANLKPVTSTYNAVLYTLSRAPVKNRLRYAQRAEQMLEQMDERAMVHGERDVQPDVRSWATVLRAWTRSRQPDAAENAQRVLDKMERKYMEGTSLIRPNFVCFTTVMGAWGYSMSKNALDKMEAILQRMERDYEETQEADVRPNTISYITCIDAFVRKNHVNSPRRAEAIVNRMIQLYDKGLGHVKPTNAVFNCVLNAWSRSQDKDAAQKAEKILQWMETQYREGDVLLRPNEFSLCAVLNAWANHAENGGAERAIQIWEHLNSISDEERGFRPTIAIPNTVIKAIARSKAADAIQKAEEILLRLENDYQSGKLTLRPDVTTYSSVINACAYCNNFSKREEALETALRTFYKLCALQDESPNNITYGTIFKAIQNLMPISEEREELVQTLFDQCCEEGFVDSFVLTQLRFASPRLYRNLIEGPCGLGGPGTVQDTETILRNVPIDWTASVVSR